MKQMMCLLLTLVVLVGMVPVSVSAETPDTQLQNNDITIEGTNGFGNLLSEEIAQQIEDNSSGYSVLDLTIENNVAKVEYDSLEDAIAMVALYTEDGQRMLTSAKTEVAAGETEAYVTIEGDVPQYFYARAFLLDAYDYSPLCPSYDTPMYTKEMQELLASTTADYDADRVLNFDEDETTNFAVFGEDTIVIEEAEGVNTVVSTDDENATYVIENADESIKGLQEGDVLAYPYGEDQILIVKVAAIEVDGSTVTIQGTDVEMEEVFTHVKLENSGDTDDIEVDESTCVDGVVYEGTTSGDSSTYRMRAVEDTIPHSRYLSFKFFGPPEKPSDSAVEGIWGVNGTLGVSLDINFSYYVSWKRQFVDLNVDVGIKGVVKFEAGVNVSVPIPALKFKVCGLGIGFEPKFKFEAKATVELTFFAGFTFGADYENGKGFHKHTSKPKVESDLKIEGTIFIGIDLSPTLDLAGGAIMEGKVEVPVGFEITAQMRGTLFEQEVADAPVVHTCKSCVAMDLQLKGEISATLKFLKSKKLSYSTKVTPISIKIGDAYWSMDNDEFCFTTCPHQSYRVSAFVADVTETTCSPVVDTLVQADWQEGASCVKVGTTNQYGVAVTYLTPGTYVFRATVDGTEVTATKKITGPCQIELNRMVKKPADNLIADAISPDSVTDHGEVIAGGPCGLEDMGESTAYWKLYKSGVLQIDGTGEIRSYDPYGYNPWKDYRDLIKKVVIGSGVTKIGNYAFFQCYDLEDVTIPGTVTRIGTGAFSKCAWLEEITLPDSLTSIGQSAFEDCESLRSITIPAKVTTIDSWTFSGCHSLEDVTILGNVRTIYAGAFYRCYDLKEITLPDSITTIDQQAFAETGLTSIKIPNRVTTIAAYTFEECTDLKSVTIPSSVTSIDYGAFNYCNSLEDVYYDGTLSQWNTIENYGGNDCLLNATLHYSGGTALASDVTVATAAADALIAEKETVTTPAQNAVHQGDYETQVTDGYTIKKATFSNLVPGAQYVLLSMASLEAEDLLASDNLLFIDQNVAEESGELSFTYVQRVDTDIAYVVACGASNQNLKDAEIFFWDMTEDKEPQPVILDVIYNGQTLLRGVDYEILGQTDYTASGEYTCYIRGIRNYTGLVECKYTVEKGGLPGDLDDNGVVDDEDVIYLLWHTLMPTDYAVNQDVDYDRNGIVDDEDVIYLLWHTLMPNEYPL